MSRGLPAIRGHSVVDFTESDLSRLKQQYRRAEGAKKAYTDQTRDILLTNKKIIQRLQDERDRLLHTLNVTSTSENWTDVRAVQDLSAILSCRDGIDKELEAEKAKEASLNDQILQLERKLQEQRNCQGRSTRMKTNSGSIPRNTSKLENKLNRGRIYCNELFTRNEELREELKGLQMKKKHFHYAQSQMLKGLHALHKDISKLTNKCTEAYNVSVKMQEKQKMLKDQRANDVVQYNEKIRRLKREVFRQCNYDVFSQTKAVTRSNENTDDRRSENSKSPESFGLEDCRNFIRTIYSDTEESDPHKLLRDFIQVEEWNYNLLELINYQQKEADAIQKQISQLCCEREASVSEKQQQQEEHRSCQMRVSIKQNAAEQKLALYQERVGFMENLLDQLKKGISSMLQISHDSSLICNKFCSSDGGQEENIKDYVRKLDDRVNKLLKLQSYLHFQKDHSQWDIQDIDGISNVAWHFRVNTPPVVSWVSAAAAAATTAPDDDQDLVESVLLKAKEPMRREDLLTLVEKRGGNQIKEDRLT